MAGESPDRSKQRESSAETTSGSAGPVPEKRDPRLAVARDASPSKTRGTSDTATRVLSLPADASSPAESEDGSAAEDGGRSPGTSEDRMHEAVAAWVRTAEPSEDLSGDTGRKDGGKGEDGAGGGERDAGPAASAPDADESPCDDTAAEAADDDARADAGTVPAASEASGDAGTVPAARSASDDGEKDAPAADASRDEDGDGDGPEDSVSEVSAVPTAGRGVDEPRDRGSHAAAATAGATDSATDDATSQADAPDRGDDTDDDPHAASDKPGPEAGDTSSEGASEPTAEDPDAERAGAGGTPAAADTDADNAPRAKTSGHGDDTDPDAERAGAGGSAEADSPERDDDPDTDADSGTGRPSWAGGTGTPPSPGKPGTGAGDADPEADSGSGSGGKAAKGTVDQPTAVFRTRRPSVDQPTTMLKLGDLGDLGDLGAEAARDNDVDGEGDSEPPAGPGPERTSRFVALKDFDDPAARKPSRTTDASTASGAVPPAAATTSFPQVGPERTTQQPLPPRPPLDLLAELTNTPPPPQTPLRTAVRRIKIWTPLVVLLVIVFAVVQNVRPLPAPTLELTAEDSYTFEGGKPEIPWPADGQAALDVQGIGTFGSSGEQKPVPIASVAKVMTAYLILRDHPLKSGAEGPMIKIDELAEQQSDAGQESTVNVTEGDEISQREAVEAVLIASANNVARLLARWDAKSEEAFVEKMNEAAKDLGMSDTTYTDPSGLNDTTVSTAVDQVKLAKAAMTQPAFREVAAMMSYDDYKGVNHSNWNQLVGHNNVVGIKTGTTTSALGNLVFAAKKEVGGETRTVVGAVVRQPAGGKDNTILSAALTAGDELIRAAQGALEAVTIVKKGTVVGYVDDGLGGRTPVAVTEDVKAVGWAGLSVELTFAADELPRTAKAGTKIGTLTVGDGTSSALKVPVALQKDLVEPGFTDRLTRLT